MRTGKIQHKQEMYDYLPMSYILDLTHSDGAAFHWNVAMDTNVKLAASVSQYIYISTRNVEHHPV